MRTINIKVNDTNYEFICESRDTRSGFAHDCHLMINGDEKIVSHCYYWNRTWERWTYQSVCIKAVRELIDSVIDHKKALFKDSHNYKKMTAKRDQEFNEILKCSPYLNRLQDCRKQLENNLY